MKKRASQKLKTGDWVTHGLRLGHVKSNDEVTLVIGWINGEESSGPHNRAWMIEKVKWRVGDKRNLKA